MYVNDVLHGWVFMPERRALEVRDTKTAWLRETIAAMPTPVSPGTIADFRRSASPALLLHLNESPFPPSPRVAAAVNAALADLNRYPDTMAVELATELSRRIGIPVDQIVFGAGSEEILKCLINVAIDPGDEVVVPAPSFPMFEVATRLCDGVPVRVRLDAEGANDADNLLRAISAKTRIVVCCTPNPPTGGMMCKTALQALLKGVPNQILLIVDEAYCEFAHYAGGPDVLSLLATRSGPWASLRTFSKAYALAGMRIGYALCSSPEVAHSIRKVRLAYSPPNVAQAAALAALADEAHLQQTIEMISKEARRLSDGLKSLGLTVYPTAANFVSVILPMPAKPIVEELRRVGILVRDWRDREFLNQVRITVGRPEDTDAIVHSLGEILRKQEKPNQTKS